MTSFFLILIIVALFSVLLAYETVSAGRPIRLASSGLFTWLVSGNWPAKVGAGLVIIGIGALLRYAFANIDLPAEMKLGGGALASAILGLVALRLKNQPKRRAVHLALAGASFGVAYLTAYSAYGFFNYLNDVNALALLALVSVAAGVFAFQSRAMSVAILAMVGAYIAPKFAIATPGVLQVYGYYLLASVFTLVMVTWRGWRPLIHLSFLFTLAGATFFGWNSRLYDPVHYSSMQPLLLALTLVHLVMPLLERQQVRSARLLRFDTAYFVLLPLAAAWLTLKIAPDLRVDGATGLGLLALIWGGIALVLHVMKREEAGRHALVAIALFMGAVFCAQEDLPWLQMGLAFSVAGMAAGTRMGWPRNAMELACAATALFGALNVIDSLTQTVQAKAFLNELFARRIGTATLMMIGAWLGERQSIGLARMLGLVGAGWAILSILAELLRLQVNFLPQLVYGIILAGIGLSIVLFRRKSFPEMSGGFLIFGLVACGWWAMHGASYEISIAYLVLTFALLIGLAWAGRDSVRRDESDFSPSLAIGLLPFALLPWAMSVAEFGGLASDFFEASVAMLGIGAAGLAARFWLSNSARWNDRIQPLHVYLTAFALLCVTLFYIERGVWPVVFELLGLAYLLAYLVRRNREQSGVGFGVGAMIVLSVALVLQAMLLRGFGPDGAVLNAADINKMDLPAAASLMWVVFGAGLAWWGTHSRSRSTWTVGALLLALAALKLVLFDFGALGQLGNILAFIAAGLVFLGVAWFAPIPSKTVTQDPPLGGAYSGGTATGNAEPEVQGAAALVQPIPAPLRVEPREIEKSPQAPDKSATRNDDAAIGFSYRGQDGASTVYRDRKDPIVINGLWLILIGLSITTAVLFSAWHKYNRQQKLQFERQQTADAKWKAQWQDELDSSGKPEITVHPEPSPRPPKEGATQPKVSGQSQQFPSVFQPGAEVNSTDVKVLDACANFVERLPSSYVVYAAGDYQGRKLGGDRGSGRQTGHFEVVANLPGRPVVLALGAYEPSIWNIRWTPGTKVVGVLISGYHTQRVVGLPQDVPLLNVSYESKSPCGYFYVTRENAAQADASLRKILGRSAQSYILAMDGRIDLGAQTAASSLPVPINSRLERYVDRNGRIEYRQVPIE